MWCVLLSIRSLFVCLFVYLPNEGQKGVELDWRRFEEEIGDVEKGETRFRIHNVRKQSFFNKRRKKFKKCRKCVL